MTNEEAAAELLAIASRTREHPLCPTCEVITYSATGSCPEGFRECTSHAAYYKPCQPDDPEGYAWVKQVPLERYKAFRQGTPGAFDIQDLLDYLVY